MASDLNLARGWLVAHALAASARSLRQTCYASRIMNQSSKGEHGMAVDFYVLALSDWNDPPQPEWYDVAPGILALSCAERTIHAPR